MDSPTACSRYIAPSSKKRVFVSGSSSGCQDVEVLEISAAAVAGTSRSSKPKSPKRKEVICHEIIDVDMDEDCEFLIECETDISAKGKKTVSGSLVGDRVLFSEETGKTSDAGAAGLNDSTNVDDFSSDLLYGEDEWIESYYDDIIYDDDTILESHFDHMDIPTGVEVPFPWLPNDTKAPTASTSTYPSKQFQSDGVNVLPGLNSSLKHSQTSDLSSSSSNSIKFIQTSVGNQHTKPKKRLHTSSGTVNLSSQPSSGSLTLKSAKEHWHSSGKSKKNPHPSHFMPPSHYSQFPPGPMYASSLSYPSLGMPHNALGVGQSMPAWNDLPLGTWDSPLGSSGYMDGSPFSGWVPKSSNNVSGATSIETSGPTRAGPIKVDEVLPKFDNFKKFDTVEDYSDHYYCKNNSTKQPPKNWAKRIQEEWKILEKDLPDEIFVRVYESRMDLLRAVIIGAEGTPYHDGLFFFDVFFPSAYPNVPPQVHYHSGGLRINPNLYRCGKVCLSLLNTWTGVGQEKWIPGVSTILQVLVSIQGLILNAKPYFNEPGYERTSGTAKGQEKSLEYNERTFIYSLRTMVYNMRRPPKYFEDFVYGYFYKHGRDILVSCKAYLDGAQVGCLVRGGVQDVDEGDKSCSQQFRNNLAAFITTLVNTFSEIGAKDCQEFLCLANKGNGPPNAFPMVDLFG